MNKLERLLFYAIILLLPTQLGKHFWPSFSFVEGLRIDYLSPTLYATDVLIILLFLTWAVAKFSIFNFSSKGGSASGGQFSIKSKFKNSFQIGLLVVFLLLGITSSLSPIAGFYKLAKIAEFGFLGFFIATKLHLKKDLALIILVLSLGVVFESLLAVVQFLKQSSVGGILWFFGERTFSGQTPGIANANLNGQLVLRPYGTFPHPNVLAGYLVIVMTLISAKFKVQSSKLQILVFVSLVLGTVALLLTLSRVAIVVWLLVMGSWLIVAFKKNFLIGLLVVLVFIGSISLTPLSPRFTSLLDSDYESLVRRQELSSVAVAMWRDSPIFGVGLNNFLVKLPEYQKPTAGPIWLQPVHNIYLLILAETGIAGFLFFLWFGVKTYQRIRKRKSLIPNSLFIIISSALVLGFFDHYFLTLQQGQLLLTLVLGLFFLI